MMSGTELRREVIRKRERWPEERSGTEKTEKVMRLKMY